MNRTAIKNFAIWARRYLREQVKARAAQYGITDKSITQPQTVTGGLLVAGQTLNATETNQYEQLRNRLQDLTLISSPIQAVATLIDEIAYTWFNRLAALRFMEVNGYIGRVLSSSDPNLVDPDLLRDASSIAEMGDLPGLDLDTLNEWRGFANRDPNPDEFLYRRLLLAQCKALAEGIPAVFDPRQNYQALFLPGNLLNQDSIVRRLVKEIPEEDWQDIEVVGWLYQFYISERKDEVIGAKSKVAAADIPAATQLFTPHWIVQYMVENSLGRLWLESHPESRLREYMPYYLENQEPLPNPLLGGEGTREENSCSPQRVEERCFDFAQHKSLTPQELTVIDPACGSGHILVYAFDLLFEIYKEQGYLERDIPALILTHNLYGLDIDERAAQLASFAVLMKARSHNSRILRKPPVLNITAVRPTHSQTLPLATELNPEDWQPLIEAFKDADNLGSLITAPPFDAEKLQGQLDNLEASNSLFREWVPTLQGLLLQAELLRNKYLVVVANPPYMGSKSLNDILRNFATKNYPDSKSDAFSIFIERFLNIVLKNGFIGLMTPFTWMFLSSYEKLRKRILSENTITSLIRPEYHAFFDSAYVPICTFTLLNKALPEYQGTFIDLNKFYGADLQPVKVLEAIKNPDCGYLHYAKAADFVKIPGSAIAYWVKSSTLNIYQKFGKIEDVAFSDGKNVTGDVNRFLRFFWEVNKSLVDPYKQWRLYAKGGGFRRWSGNLDNVVNRSKEAIDFFRKNSVARLISEYLWYKNGITWGTVTSSEPSFRYLPQTATFDTGGLSIFFNDESQINSILGFLNSVVANYLLKIVNPTLNFNYENILKLPYRIQEKQNFINDIVTQSISLSRQDWDNFETSWDFQTHPLLRHNTKHLSEAFNIWQSKSETAFRELQRLEEENNRYWIEAYGLQDELIPEVPDNQITIRRADLNKDIRSLISYAVGCIMGRYSLDKPGLIHAGQPFDPSLHRYNEDTLARIRTDYVLELQVKLEGEIVRAQQQLENASSSAAKKAATNRLKDLQAQQLELRDYQAKLQTLADARINLDLDDGVAYNYTRFKGLVYEGADLKIADLQKASQWKLELLK
ncbi:BREX-1 system adenine-specific DNA-methyltransferase PglX [Nostoc sp.]